jgi:hypothetical protein
MYISIINLFSCTRPHTVGNRHLNTKQRYAEINKCDVVFDLIHVAEVLLEFYTG